MSADTPPSRLISESMRDFSRLEGTIDELLVSIHQKFPAIISTKPVPLNYGPKIRRLIACYLKIPLLRRFGLADGSLDLIRIGYRLEEIFEHRNHMAHGDLIFTASDEVGTTYIFRRWVRDANMPGGLRLMSYKTHQEHIVYLRRTARMLSTYFGDSIRHFNGEITSDFYNQEAKKQSRQREWWNHTGQQMNLKFSENLKGLNRLITGEVA